MIALAVLVGIAPLWFLGYLLVATVGIYGPAALVLLAVAAGVRHRHRARTAARRALLASIAPELRTTIAAILDPATAPQTWARGGVAAPQLLAGPHDPGVWPVGTAACLRIRLRPGQRADRYTTAAVCHALGAHVRIASIRNQVMVLRLSA